MLTSIVSILIVLTLSAGIYILWRYLTGRCEVKYDNPTGFVHAGYKGADNDLDRLASKLLMDEESSVWRTDKPWFYTNLHCRDNTVLWLGFDDYMKPGTVQLAYRSVHKNPLMIIGRIPDPHKFMEGALLGIHTLFLKPTAIYFDCPVYRMTSMLEFPFYADISLSAFPLSMELMAPEDLNRVCESLPDNLVDLQTSRQKKPPRTSFDSQIYEYENNGSHLSITELVGYIVDSQTRKNHITGKNFYAITVYTSGLFIDLIAEKRKLRLAPEKGMILKAKCRLSGELFSVKTIKSLNE